MNQDDKKEEPENEPTNKNLILRQKLTKLFIERELNKYKYNKQIIPDNLKYESEQEMSKFSTKREANIEIKSSRDSQKNDNSEENKNSDKTLPKIDSNLDNKNEDKVNKEENTNNNEETINEEEKLFLQKGERNKMLLRLIINKELGSISKELHKQRKESLKNEDENKSQKIKDNLDNNIEGQTTIKSKKEINNKNEEKNNNEKEEKDLNRNKEDENKIDQNDDKENYLNEKAIKKKENLLKIMELLKNKKSEEKTNNLKEEQIQTTQDNLISSRTNEISLNTKPLDDETKISENKIQEKSDIFTRTLKKEKVDDYIVSKINSEAVLNRFYNIFKKTDQKNDKLSETFKPGEIKKMDLIGFKTTYNTSNKLYKPKINKNHLNQNGLFQRENSEIKLPIEINKSGLVSDWESNINFNIDNKSQASDRLFYQKKSNYQSCNNIFLNNTQLIFQNKQNNVYTKKNMPKPKDSQISQKKIEYIDLFNTNGKNLMLNKQKMFNSTFKSKIKRNNSVNYNRKIIPSNKFYTNNKNIANIKIPESKSHNHSFSVNFVTLCNNDDQIIKLNLLDHKNNKKIKNEKYAFNNHSPPMNNIYVKKHNTHFQKEKNNNKIINFQNKQKENIYSNNININTNYNKIYINNKIYKNQINNNIKNNNNFNIKSNRSISSEQILYLSMIEHFIVLEDKLNEITISLNNEKLTSNYSMGFWNYFYSSIFFLKEKSILKETADFENIKISINYILFSVMICYDFSFESNKLINIYLSLFEILDINHKNIILMLEYITKKILPSNRNDIWVVKSFNLINNFKLSDDYNSSNIFDNSFVSNQNVNKISNNTITLIQKLNFILLTNKTNFNECLISFFKVLQNKSFSDINEYFKQYLLREEFIECSITASTFLKEKENFTSEKAPYLPYNNIKKFSLVLDFDETLIHFKLQTDKHNEGVLKLRPGLFKFLDLVKNYYELILFTEASEIYSKFLINTLEQNKKYFDYKLYRQHTVILGKDFVKDLTRIGRPLNTIIIIDNVPQNFKLQKNNGIIIKSFWGDEDEDNVLEDLSNILVKIGEEEEDVRKGLIKYHEEIVTKITSNIYKHKK